MVNASSALGHFIGPAHHYPVRVYFEDTDLSGVVYHANYLRFMERARSDMLTALGIGQRASLEGGAGAYAVSELAIRYRRPAKLEDDLVVVSHVAEIGAATATIHQAVMRGDELVSEAQVSVCFLSPEGKPRRQPKDWVARFAGLIQETE